MAKLNLHKKPSFAWQGLLIVLPILLLVAVGFFSLRQDKILAQHDAAERAQAIADDLLPRLWAEITAAGVPDQPGTYAFEVDGTGQLLFPPPYVTTPIPKPFSLSELTDEQAKNWLAVQRVDLSDESDLARAMQACRDFLALDPPEKFAAAIGYSLGLLLAKQGQAEAAAQAFDSVLQKYPNAICESGLPLRPMVQLKLIELETLARHTTSATPELLVVLNAFCSNAVYYPTPLTPYLLSMVLEHAKTSDSKSESNNWLRLWERDEQCRRLYYAARQRFRGNTGLAIPFLPLAVGQENPDWLAIRYVGTPPQLSAGHASPGKTTSSHQDGLPARVFQRPQTGSLAVSGATQVEGQVTNFESTATSHKFVCLTESELGSKLAALVRGTKLIPEYFGIGLEVGERPISFFSSYRQRKRGHENYFGLRGDGANKEYLPILATNVLASATSSEAGAGLLKVNVYLTSPKTLYERQSQRTLWVGSLIGVSAGVAFIGLIAAWGAFHRQQQLGEMKSNFVSSVSHELRAPIASVRLLAESLERGKIQEPQKQNEYFRFIGQECRRLSSLIENVLDFSRIEQGRKQYEFEPTDLLALSRQTVSLMETYAAEKQVTLKLDSDNLQAASRNPGLCIDGRAIQQALVNLIDNAIKHSPKGGTVTVGLEPLSETPTPDGAPRSTLHAPRLCLWVEDHGEGILPGEHEKIFERFYRLGPELRRETQGVGIGLSIVKHIVEAHGGKVLVRSAIGAGSRFTIELPVTSKSWNAS